MFGDILRVEQFEAARNQPRHQMHQCHLRGVTGVVKHALAEEGAAEADPIEPADEVVRAPNFDAMTVAEFMQSAIEITNALVDPGVLPARLRRGTTRYHRLERGIDRDGECIRAHGAREARGNPEAIERYDAAHFRLDPEQRRVIGAFGHREDAAGIGAQQHFGRDFG